MLKHIYEVNGVGTSTHVGEPFYGQCIAQDILGAIQMFTVKGLSVHKACRTRMVGAYNKDSITKLQF